MQRVTLGIDDPFGTVEKALWETFVSELFEGLGEGEPERGVTRLTVKQAGLALLDPTLIAPENWTASYVITGHLVASLRGQVEFRTADHLACCRESWAAVWRWNQQRADEAMATTIARSPVQGARQLRRVTNTGAWLTVQPSTVNGTELGA